MRTLTRSDWQALSAPQIAAPATASAATLWFCWLHRAIARLYYSRITVRNPGRLREAGPVLFIGTHRNGAVDGFVHRAVLPETAFLVSSQLRRHPLGRLFFCGIEVARTKDEGDTSANAEALDRCVDHLAAGGRLFVFPEGTSTLGPQHLPYRSGAARIALAYAERCGRPLRVVPVGLHYERPWAFRSRVEIVVGESVETQMPANLAPGSRLGEMRRRFTRSLESVGVNMKSDVEFREATQLAYAATLGSERSFSATLKALEPGIPTSVRIARDRFEAECGRHRPWRHQDVPLFPGSSVLPYALALVALSPFVIAGALLNLPPLLAGALAARKFADGPNVVALWRILVGLPVFALWSVGCAIALAVLLGPAWACGYLVLTAAAIAGWYRAKKLAVTVRNGLFAASLRPAALHLRDLLLREVRS